MKLRALVTSAVTALAAVPFLITPPAPAAAHHAWGSYHWARTSNSFTLAVGDNVDSTWRPYLDEAIRDWNGSSVLDLAKVAGGTTPRQCKPTGGRVEVCNAAYGRNGWLGIAQIWVSGGHITQGVTKMNDSYSMRAAEKQYVMCQEVGHTFGLGHQNENHDNRNVGSCMDYSRYPEGGVHSVGGTTIDYGPSNESPNTDTAAGGTGAQHGDFEQLVAIYGHTDGTTTVGPLAAGTERGRSGTADDDGPNNPAEFGRPVGPRDAHGRDILFVTDLPNGGKRFTHVYWVVPERHDHRP